MNPNKNKPQPKLFLSPMRLICLAGCMTLSPLAYSSSHQQVSDLFSMPLEQLLQQKVSVASFGLEDVDWASAVVTRYNRKQMLALGVRSIPGMLSLVPGVLVQPGHRGNQQIMVRGVIDSWNQKVLFLLNDVPYWMPSHGEIPLNGIPFDLINHIEVIRGPGAVTHGSNATAAVIKIVTRQDKNIEISQALGPDTQNDSNIYLSDKIDDWSIVLAAENKDSGDLDAYIDGTLANPNAGRVSMQRESESAFFQASNGTFSVTAHSFESTHHGIDGFSSTENLSEIVYEGDLLALKWQHQWEDIRLELHTDYNQFLYKSDIDNIISSIGIDAGAGSIEFENEGDENHRWRSGFQFHYRQDNHTLTFGYDYEERSVNSQFGLVPNLFELPLFNPIPENRMFENTVFIQGDYDIKQWRLVYGARYLQVDTSSDDTDEQVLPRFTLMYRIDDQRTARLFYGVGYNSPSFAQKGAELSNVILPAINTTRAERISISEAAYQEKYNHWYWGINAFHYKTIDFIQAVRIADTTDYQNADDVERSGFEIELNYTQENLHLLANVAYLHHGGSTKENDPAIILAPKIITNLGGSYSWNEHTFGSTLSYLHHNETLPSYSLINLNYSYAHDNWLLSLKAQNILDKKRTTFDTRLLAQIEQESNQALIAELRYRLN